LWFHLSKKQQKKRFEELSKDRRTSWRVTKQDWANHEGYDTFRPICERALRRTSFGESPWNVIEGYDARYRSLAAGRLVHQALRARLDAPKETEPFVASVETTRASGEKTLLASLDLSGHVEEREYE